MQDRITTKEAGSVSELVGMVGNPINWAAAVPAAAAAGLTSTRDTEEQAGADQDMWSNLLVPGRAGYNITKRHGYSLRNPDLKRAGLEAQIKELESELKELDMDNNEVDNNENDPAQKVAAFIGDVSELLQELGQERDFLRNKVAALQKTAICEDHGHYENIPCPKCDGSAKKEVEASQKIATFGPEREVVETTVDHLVDAQFLKQADRDQAVIAILDDPVTALLSFCDKLAARRVESEAAVMPKLGHAVDEVLESDSARESRESDKAFEQRFNAFS